MSARAPRPIAILPLVAVAPMGFFAFEAVRVAMTLGSRSTVVAAATAIAGLVVAAITLPLVDRSSRGVIIALLVIAGGTLFRFNTYLIAFNPGDRWTYFPAVPEIVITLGLISLEVVAYLWIVKKFPILGGMRAATSER